MTDTVNEVRNATVVQSTLTAFMSGTSQADADIPSQFDGDVLTDLGRNSGKGRVEVSVPFHARNGMSQWAGLVQLSQGIGAHEFKAFADSPTGPNWWESPGSKPRPSLRRPTSPCRMAQLSRHRRRSTMSPSSVNSAMVSIHGNKGERNDD
ncbi:hypothetical protein NHF46_21515 [Arthrobacter alpinus]|nr:hypothetical protein [Arthrobacter alpinus]